jgi:hypothetical protein
MNAYVMTGTLTDGRTVTLDEALPLLGGKVRITVETIDAAVPKQTLNEWLEGMRSRRAAAGVAPLTDDQIEEWIQDIRSGRGN